MRSVIDHVVWRTLLPGQKSQLCIADAETGTFEVVWESNKMVVEAPNWRHAHEEVVFNSAGQLYLLRLGASKPTLIETPGLMDHNNDHQLTRDGESVISSSEGSGHLFVVSMRTGQVARISPERQGTFSYFLQGISPDGATVSFTGAHRVGGGSLHSELYTLPLLGGEPTQWTDWGTSTVGFEWDPRDQWIYFNSERAAREPGHAQLFRMTTEATQLEQLTSDERVNWFPKVSPDGSRIVYLSFPSGTVGHPANLPVVIRQLEPDTGEATDLISLFGGQGTMNMNSWSSDSRHFAFMRYPVDER